MWALVTIWSLLRLILHQRVETQLRAPRSLVHVVQTRFMQYQPHLVALGRARLEEFTRVTLPSMLAQTTQDYVWIIRTDPDLDDAIRRPLLQAIQDHDHILLVGSNENPEGFRCSDCLPSSKTIWSGSTELLQSAWKDSQSTYLLETRLDADDGLYVDYLAQLQRQAALKANSPWSVWCPNQHWEWQYDAPWETHRGSLWGVQTNYCVTAGLTWGYAPGTSLESIGQVREHQAIYSTIPKCETESTGKCLSRIDPGQPLPSVLRVRSPTSAGMERVGAREGERGWKGRDPKKWNLEQDVLYLQLPLLFGIDSQQIELMWAALESNQDALLNDAMAGQCTKGHSCKDKAKEALSGMLRGTKSDS